MLLLRFKRLTLAIFLQLFTCTAKHNTIKFAYALALAEANKIRG